MCGSRARRSRRPAGVAVYGVDVKTHTTAEGIRAGLVKQLYTPVYWAATVRTMIAAGATHIVECGPGKVLDGPEPARRQEPGPEDDGAGGSAEPGRCARGGVTNAGAARMTAC